METKNKPFKPENKEELYALLTEFQEKMDLMIEILAERYDNKIWNDLSDNEKKLMSFYNCQLIDARANWYMLEHEFSQQLQKEA